MTNQIDRTVSAMLRNNKAKGGHHTVFSHGADPVYPNVEKQVLSFGADKTEFASHVGLVNMDENRVITVATNSYEILDHKAVVDMADAAVEKAGYKDFQRTVVLINSGDKMLVEYTLSEKTYEVRKGDEVHPRLTFKNSYDLNWAASAMGGLFRLVCSNGAYIGEAVANKRKHTASLSPEAGDRMLVGIMNEMPQIQQRLGVWAKTPIHAKQALNIGALKLSQNEKDALTILRERSTGVHIQCKQVEVPAIEGGTDGKWEDRWTPVDDTTVYDVWNLLTEFTTHRVHSPIRKDTISTATNTLFRSGKLLVQ